MNVRTSDAIDNVPLCALQALVVNDFSSVMITEGSSDSPEHKIVFVNEAFSQMTGYEPSDVLGRTPELMQGPETNRELLGDLRDKIQRGEPFHGQTINYRMDGSEFTIEWKVIPLRGENGDITHHAAVQREINAHMPSS